MHRDCCNLCCPCPCYTIYWSASLPRPPLPLLPPLLHLPLTLPLPIPLLVHLPLLYHLCCPCLCHCPCLYPCSCICPCYTTSATPAAVPASAAVREQRSLPTASVNVVIRTRLVCRRQIFRHVTSRDVTVRKQSSVSTDTQSTAA